MYSSSDFEHLFIRYKAEAMPQGESMQDFCLKNKVPYNLFHKWYKDTRHHIVPVQVEGKPVNQEPEKALSASVPSMGGALSSPSVRFMIDIRMTGGMHMHQRNLSYEGLKNLVEKLAERYRHEQVLLPAQFS